MKLITDINDLIELSINDHNQYNSDIPCKFIIYEDNAEYEVYNATIAYRDILLYSNKAVLNYVVDSYGDNHTIELFNIEE